MNTIKRLTRLSVEDLQDLQRAILGEIHRREKLASAPLTSLMGQIQRRKDRADVAEADGSVMGGRLATSKPAPAAAQPLMPRRAA